MYSRMCRLPLGTAAGVSLFQVEGHVVVVDVDVCTCVGPFVVPHTPELPRRALHLNIKE